MLTAEVKSPPIVALGVIVFCAWGWLNIGVFALDGTWSGLASLMLFILIFVAPVFCIILAIMMMAKIASSRFHRAVFMLLMGYAIVGVVLILAFLRPRIMQPRSTFHLPQHSLRWSLLGGQRLGSMEEDELYWLRRNRDPSGTRRASLALRSRYAGPN
jgi:hypothetical protein